MKIWLLEPHFFLQQTQAAWHNGGSSPAGSSVGVAATLFPIYL